MALTPEDVVNKRFQPTKFREGYDQDEVDDFLDEVVVELRRLGQENEELRQRMTSGDSRQSELPQATAAPGVFAAPVPTPVAEPVAAPAPEQAATAGSFAGADPSDPNNTNNLLQLARRLHEEHVREGIEKRDALIAEGHATAARIVSDAEQQQRAELGTLEQERRSLEERVEDLRSFEREYRSKLKGHLEGLLHDLDGASSPVGETMPEAALPDVSMQQPLQQEPLHQEPIQAEQESASYGGVSAQPQSGFPGFGGN